ncbi:MAG: hypothetical protein A2Y14_03115 [Verrucomicrobia bacterium GWF2_51_19]|nr:MAG: hypothetical protein A2Y14_03115 [Verrucomicrobia bacterium GWF2_51_19]HCJ11594.1 hypothetical protein [Opitutae bacterium]
MKALCYSEALFFTLPQCMLKTWQSFNNQQQRPLQNGPIARPEERGQQEPTDVGDLARTTRTPLEVILERSL